MNTLESTESAESTEVLTASENYSRKTLWMGLFLALVFVIAFQESIKPLLILWLGLGEVSDNSGLLALACTFYLIYSKREQFVDLEVSPNLWGGVFLVFFGFVWLIGIVVGIQSLQYIVLPLLIMSAIALWLGNQYLYKSFIPLSILFFVLPIWWPVLPVLRDITTSMTYFNLNLLDKPVFMQGYILRLPGGSFLIDESCAGLRFLLVTSLLSFVCKDLFQLSIKRFCILLVIGVALSLVANWIRVLIIVLVGDYTLMQSELVEDHANLGWVLYGIVVLIPFFVVNGYLSKNSAPASKRQNPHNSISLKKYYSYFVITGLLVMSAPLVSNLLKMQAGRVDAILLPTLLGDWSLNDGSINPSQTPSWRPNYLNSTSSTYRNYSKNNEEQVAMILIQYENQIQGAELINVENTITDEVSWFEIPGSGKDLQFELNDSRHVTISSLTIDNRRGQSKQVVYWFNIGGAATVDPTSAKLYQIVKFFQGRSDASLYALAADCKPTCSSAELTLLDFLRVSYPHLQPDG